MATPNDNIYRLYQNGLKYFSLPDFETFKNDMKDEEKRKRFYNNMQGAYTLPDFNTFSTDIGAVSPAPAHDSQPTQSQPTQQTVHPVQDTTAQQAAVTTPAVETASQPAQPQGWKPSPVDEAFLKWQMEQGEQRLQKVADEGQQQMAGITKGNSPTAFMGEREVNPQTGQMETAFYTKQGERVDSQIQQSLRNNAYQEWWENNTDEGKQVKERRLQREFNTQISTIWDRHDTAKGPNAAERAWEAADSLWGERVKENHRTAAMRPTFNSWDMAGAAMWEEQDNFKDRLTTHDLDALMANAWDNLGEDGQQALIDDCFQILKARYPGTDELVLYNGAKDLALQQSNLRLYNLAVEKNAPKSAIEYFFRTVKDANLLTSLSKGFAVAEVGKTGDMAAYEMANEQYRQDGHKILGLAGTVTGMMFDPTTALSGYVGGAAARGALWAGGRWLAGRGATSALTNAMTRQFATSMSGRLFGGIVGGGVNFATYEGLKEVERQFEHGGNVTVTDDEGNLLREGRYVNNGYSADEVLSSAGHGLVMGAAVGWLGPVTGNVSDKLVRGGGKLFGKEMSGISNAYGKMATRAGLYTGSTVLEGTIFSIPEWIEGKEDAFDVWTDNMAMMVGFKATHMLKSAGGVLGDLKASFDSPTNGQKNRLDFESRLKMRMDSPTDGGLRLTKDEEAELARYGYDLRELVKSAESTGDAKAGALITADAPEIVSQLTTMVKDTRISEAARAKMYYLATGRKLPVSPIMRGEMFEDENGNFVVESHGANGVITSRTFTQRKSADLELERIARQAELNQLEFGERFQPVIDYEGRVQEACRRAAAKNGWNAIDVYKVYEAMMSESLKGKPKELSDAQKNIYSKIVAEFNTIEATDLATAKRTAINEKHGVDIDVAIRKDIGRRSEEEQSAINEYIEELYPRKQSMFEDGQRLLPGEEPNDITDTNFTELDPDGNPIDPRFDTADTPQDYDPHAPQGAERPIGRAVMKYQDRPVEVMSGCLVMTDDGTMIDHEQSDRTIVIRDIETGEIEMVSPEAILSYKEYAPEPTGVPSVEGTAPEASSEVPPTELQPKYTSGRITIRNSDGTESRGFLTGEIDEQGRHEYYVEGDLTRLHYASESELDNILSDYVPDEPAHTEQPTEASPAKSDEYNAAYENVLARVPELTDEEIGKFIDEVQGLNIITDAGRGILDAYKQEQQRRVEAQKPQPTTEEQVIEGGINGTAEGLKEAFDAERERIGNEWLDNPGVQEALKVYTEGATSVEELVEKAKADSTDERTKQRLDTLLEFDSTRQKLQALLPQADNNGAENIISPSVDELKVPTEPEQPQTLLSRIPRNEKGEPVFEQAESPEHGWDALVEFSEGDVNTAKTIANTMTEEKRKVLEKAQKLKPKGKTATEIRESIKANAVEVTKAQAEYDMWSRIAGVQQSREDAVRSRQDAEAQLAAEEERQWQEAKRKMDKRVRETAEEYRDIAEVQEMLQDLEPKNIEEVAALVLSGGKVLWGDKKTQSGHVTAKGVQSSLGYGEGERKKFFGLFASAENGGRSLEELAETAMEEMCATYGVPYDNQGALNALLDVLQGARTRGDITNYIANNRIEQARRFGEAWREREAAEQEKYCQENFHMSAEEYEAYQEVWDAEVRERDANFDEKEYWGNIADEEALREKERNQQNNQHTDGHTETDSTMAGMDPAGTRAADGRGGELLPGERPAESAGTRGVEAQRPGSGGESGQGLPAAAGGVAGGTPERGIAFIPEKRHGKQGRESAEAENLQELGGLHTNRKDNGGEPRHGVEGFGIAGQGERGVEASALSQNGDRKEPTEAQKAAGNYPKKHVRVDGYAISIENEKGTVRRGKDADGKEWATEMHNDYGYIRGTKGVDGDHIDVYLSDTPEQGDVFVVDQYNPDGTFDEHKVMYGFPTEEAARSAYLSNYEDGWENGRRLDITHVSKDEFDKWIESSKRKTKPFAEYKSVEAIRDEADMPTSLQWSNERAGNGEPFLVGKDGGIDLVEIPQEVFDKMGIDKAPFRLTPSMVAHVYERHKKELRLSSPEDAVDAILDVMTNFDRVRKGRENTYVFAVEGTRSGSARRAVTFVLEYDKGEWLGIKTVGYDRIANIKELPILWEKGEINSSTTGVAPANVTSDQSSRGDQTDGIASNQNTGVSERKVTNSASEKQIFEGESSESQYRDPLTEDAIATLDSWGITADHQSARNKLMRHYQIGYQRAGRILDEIMSAQKPKAESGGDQFAQAQAAVDAMEQRRPAFEYREEEAEGEEVAAYRKKVAPLEALRKAWADAGDAFEAHDRHMVFDGDKSQEAIDMLHSLKAVQNQRLESFVDALWQTDADKIEAIALEDYATELRDGLRLIYNNRDDMPEELAGKVEELWKRVGRIIKQHEFGAIFDAAKELVEPDRKKEKPFALKDILPKSPDRTIARGIIHDGETHRAIATDNRVVVMSGKEYEDEHAGKLVQANGEVIDVNAKRFVAVVHTDETPIATVPMKDDLVRRIDATLKALKPTERERAGVVVAFADGMMGSYSLASLYKFLRGAQHIGATELRLYERNDMLRAINGQDGVAMLSNSTTDAMFKIDLRNDSKSGSTSTVVSPAVLEDFGEEIAGARKDMLRALSRQMDSVDEAALVAMTLSKAMKRPNFGKMQSEGLMTEAEARTAEALWQAVYTQKKPAATRKNQRAIAEWAKATAAKVSRLRDFVNGDAETRRRVIEELSELRLENEAGEREHFEKLKEWNPEKHFEEPVFTPDEASVAAAVLAELGGGEHKIAFKLCTDSAHQWYKIKAANGDTVWRLKSTRDLDEAVKQVALLVRISENDSEVIYPAECFRVVGRTPKMAHNGKYVVRWIAGRNHDIKEATFDSKEAAEAKAAELKAKEVDSRINPLMERTGGFEEYKIEFTHPITREYFDLEQSFADKASAQQAISEDMETLSGGISARLNKNQPKPKKENYGIASGWDRKTGKVTYSVVYTGKDFDPMGGHRGIVKDFGSRSEAEAWLKANEARLEAALEADKKERSEFVYFEQSSTPRQGEDYRGGKDMTPESFTEAFGFRGVQFGNWTNGADRQAALNETYDAFMDLAKVLGVSPRALSLNGELGLAFGARGGGKYNAHYEPTEVVINLTKTRGAGSLAHEWWHALDNYLMRKGGSALLYATQNHSAGGLREELRDAIVDMVKAVRASDYHARSGRQRNAGYWASEIEETARLFAEWVNAELQGKGERNHFLSRGIEPEKIEERKRRGYETYKTLCEIAEHTPKVYEEWVEGFAKADNFPYPLPEEIVELGAKMRSVFDVMREGESETGVPALYEPAMAYGREDFDAMRERAVAEKGVVMPGLRDGSVRVVSVPRHDFAGEKPIAEAKAWAKANIVGEHEATDSHGHAFDYTISARSVDKYLSASATDKSDNLGVHLSVLKQLPEVIAESIEAEVHPDYNKGADGVRGAENGHNEDKLIHRFYGLAKIDGENYRVKTTIIESRENKVATAPHNFEVTEIELLPEGNSSELEPTVSREKPGAPGGNGAQESASSREGSLGTAKLLQNVEKSYDKGVKLLDASADREREDTAAASEPHGRFGRKKVDVSAMRSLFDIERDGEEMTANADVESANAAVEKYGEDYADYLERAERLESEIAKLAAADEVVPEELRDELALSEQVFIEQHEEAMAAMAEYYRQLGNTEEDSRRMARDRMRMTQSEVEIALGKRHRRGLGEVESLGELPRLQEGEFALVERKFVRDKVFNFTGAEKIESIDDVAYIFRELENSAQEHGFVVLVKDGKPMVLHLGMGAFDATLVNQGAIRMAYETYGADEMFFVHNHPSGALIESVADLQIVKSLQDAFRGEVDVHSLIIDTTSGRYYSIDEREERNARVAPSKSVAIESVAYDGQEYHGYEVDAKPIKGPDDIANYISTLRLGDREKVSFLVLNKRNQIVANLHTPYQSIEDGATSLAHDMAVAALRYGGASVVPYGNRGLAGSRIVANEVARISGKSVKVLDALKMEGGVHQSAFDSGLLGEPTVEYGSTPGTEIRFREVEDEAVLQEFAEGKTVKAYRCVQIIDGDIYSPIASKVGGKSTPKIKLGVPEQAEEHPEIIKKTIINKDGVEQGIVSLSKGLGKGTLDVAYNPYIHASLTPLNDQFTSAHIRPNLAIMEVEIPISELTSGYRADKAKNSVGEMSWHSGTISGQLAALGKPRRVILSRYDKPVRLLTYREASGKIAEQLDGTDIEMNYNLIQPQIRDGLSRLGVPISETASGKVKEDGDFGEAEYITDQEIERINARQMEMAQTGEDAKQSHAVRLSKKFGAAIRVVTDVEEITHSDAKMQERMRRSAGWYDTRSGEVVLVLPNNRSVEEVAKTVFHEVVAHKGLREMIGEENYDAFCDEVFDHLKDDLKADVEREATRNFEAEPEKGYDHAKRKAVDEMFGRMAEKGFEDFTKAERGIWTKLKSKVLEAINKFLGALKLPKWVKLGDNELRYMLWKSHERMATSDKPATLVEKAKDIAKRNELGLTAEVRFRDGERGETADIWKDQSVGLEERITNAALRLSNNQSGDLTLRNDAMRAIGGNLTSLRRAMAAQRAFDQATVKRVADLARILMQNGYLSGMTSGEMQRLISAVKNSVGHKEVKESVQKVMDIMVQNQLRNGEATLRQLLAIKGSKVDARGVEVQGMLDVDGQRTMEVVKKAMTLKEDDITDRIAEALNRMSDPDNTIADAAALEYAGLNMALDYVQNIAESKAEEKALRDNLKTAKEDKDAGRMTEDAYKQFVESTEDAIRKNRIERAEAYFNLVGRLSDSLRGSIENAKAFREAEKARVQEIHHNANSDMEGRPNNEHHHDDWKDKFMNNGFVQFALAPLGTFDQILRVFGSKSANGEGYLWNRFMRGWVDCRNKELLGVKDKFARLDEKAAEVFGKGKTWGDLIRMEGKLPKATVSFWDGGEMRDHELTQGNLLYIYMVDKMTDGRMKLRRMGITEDDVQNIENMLDPRFKEIGDWLQEEFLVETRNEYNETHKRMFGASMAAIENYFPLKILANARIDKEEDVNQPNKPDGITTKTGSIIKRRVNNLALDITGADALSVILDHITQMEHWNAYAEWNRDLNALRTYKRFRNQVINMTTAYGGGRKLWENFNDLCLMAAGEYRPPVAKIDKSAVNLAKGVTAAKVSLRMFTALKQFLSAPAYAPEVSIRAIAKSIINPYGDFMWCLKNMPIFRERWHSRISGDPRLLKSDMDWKMWRSRVMEISSRIGMTPNAFVDAVTVSIGAKAMYETRLKQYLKEGYEADAAEKRALQDATILFNQTQQSSESPFLSTMQVDKSWLSVLFTVFRNSAMSYTRQEFDAARNLKRNLTPGQRAESVAFMRKQILRDWGVDPDNATDEEWNRANRASKKRFNCQIKKDVLRLATFGFILELAWNLGPYLPYIIFGNDDDEKEKMWDDATTHAYFGSVEGLTGGDIMSAFGNMAASGEWNTNQLTKDMPLASDVNGIIKKFAGGKNAEGINDIINLVVQMGVGVNPQSITDMAVAIMDACGDDPELSHEAAIFVMRVLQVPQSQIDKLYFDEIGLSGEEASKLTPEQLAGRYAEYKVKRGTPLAPWSWDDAERLGKYEKSAETKMQERMDGQNSQEVREAYADYEARYKGISQRISDAKKLMGTDYVSAAQEMAAIQSDPDFTVYQQFGALDKNLGRISKMWLEAQSAEEAAVIAEAIPAYRAGMVKVLSAETVEAQRAAMQELSALWNDFSGRYQQMKMSQQTNR